MENTASGTCRYGERCRNWNCEFDHPNGRAIDHGYPPQMPQMDPRAYAQMAAMTYMYPYPPANMMHPYYMPGQYDAQYNAGYDQSYETYGYGQYGYDTNAQYENGGNDNNYSGSVRPCKYGSGCRNQNCNFFHPETEAEPEYSESYDEFKSNNTDSELETPQVEDDFVCPCCSNNPYNCPNAQCAEIGRCGCLFGTEDEDDSWKDEWFADSRDCACCGGYIFKCEKKQSDCVSGNCYCSFPAYKQQQPSSSTSSEEESLSSQLAATTINNQSSNPQ